MRKWYGQVEGTSEGPAPEAVVQALAGDLNTPQAIVEMHQLAQKSDASALLASLRLLGLVADGVPAWAAASDADLSAYEAAFSTVRAEAMANKDFSKLDAMAAGVEVKMRKDGVDLVAGPAFDPDKLEDL